MNKKVAPIIAVVLLCLFMMFFWCCAAPAPKKAYVKEGKEYGKVCGLFRCRWWNYYERGLSFLDGKFLDEAVSDLNQALEQRDKDQRMARTYGMHFIDYFPHRELGITYYELGKFEQAKKELGLSINQFSTAKAVFYLDKVRKSLIEKMEKEVMPPKLALSIDTNEIWTRDDPIVLSGVAEDDNYVAGISIKGVPVFLEGSQKRISFSEPLKLAQGPHNIEVKAKNLPGKISIREIIIHVDREGPTITLEEVRVDKGSSKKKVSLKGFLYDESGVTGLSINGRAVDVSTGIEIPFTHELVADSGSLELATLDRLGNRTTASVPLASFSSGRSNVQLAFAGPGFEYYLMSGLFGAGDTNPPDIKFKGWIETQSVYLEKVYIEGKVRDESSIRSLTVNQIPVLRREGSFIFFSHMAGLKEGENVITIAATDEHGNKASRNITVIRKIPKALQLAERMSLTSFPFDQKGTVSDSCLAFQNNLINALVNRNRFRVIERDRLDVILKEQELSRTKLFDQSTAIDVGRLVAARSVITGDIIETRNGIEIVARMIDTESSEIIATEDVYGEVKGLPALMSLAEGMAIKFHRDFPLVGGVVIQKKGNHIFTDLGHEKIKLQRRLIVYKDEPVIHPVTGKQLGADSEIIAHGRITQVESEMSKAELTDGGNQAVNRNDKVITE
jgi:hypothetical protein